MVRPYGTIPGSAFRAPAKIRCGTPPAAGVTPLQHDLYTVYLAYRSSTGRLLAVCPGGKNQWEPVPQFEEAWGGKRSPISAPCGGPQDSHPSQELQPTARRRCWCRSLCIHTQQPGADDCPHALCLTGSRPTSVTGSLPKSRRAPPRATRHRDVPGSPALSSAPERRRRSIRGIQLHIRNPPVRREAIPGAGPCGR